MPTTSTAALTEMLTIIKEGNPLAADVQAVRDGLESGVLGGHDLHEVEPGPSLKLPGGHDVQGAATD